MARADESLYQRLREELFSLDMGPSEIARKVGCSACIASGWMNGEYLPSTAFLGGLHDIGVDVLYVVTGKRIWDQVNYWMDAALADIPRKCRTCAYLHDCENEDCDENCSSCEKAVVCRDCRNESNWMWRGFASVRSNTD